LKILSYNVNGLRAAVRKGLIPWLSREKPDVLCLQEIKLLPHQFPAGAFEDIGYEAHLFPAQKKGYSGVAILCRTTPDRVVRGMGIERYDDEGRFLRADFGHLSVVSAYHPSGTSGDERQEFKMRWLEDFFGCILQLRKERPRLVLCGDYNICHEEIDIHNPATHGNVSGFLPEERRWMSRFLDAGFIDTFRRLHPQQQAFSWWDYRTHARDDNKGWRIDYCLVSDPLAPFIRQASILKEAVHSDHCPVSLILDEL
jgi:exodeoxyribonuclease-3